MKEQEIKQLYKGILMHWNNEVSKRILFYDRHLDDQHRTILLTPIRELRKIGHREGLTVTGMISGKILITINYGK